MFLGYSFKARILYPWFPGGSADPGTLTKLLASWLMQELSSHPVVAGLGYRPIIMFCGHTI